MLARKGGAGSQLPCRKWISCGRSFFVEGGDWRGGAAGQLDADLLNAEDREEEIGELGEEETDLNE